MFCPICCNTVSSGRCPHTLAERTNAVSRTVRVQEDHRQGKINVGQATKQYNRIYQGDGR